MKDMGRRSTRLLAIGFGSWLGFSGLTTAAEPTTEPLLWHKPVAINAAEAVVEPFWTPELSALAQWRIDPGTAPGLSVRQSWNAVVYEWSVPPAAGPALRMSRELRLDCGGYDRLLVSLSLPRGAVLHLSAQTDRGARQATSAPSVRAQGEWALPLAGASRIESLTLEVVAGGPGAAAGWLRWIGLQDSGRLPAYFAQWDRSSHTWDTHLKPADTPLRFEPHYSLFLTGEDLEALREEQRQAVARGTESRFERRVAAARAFVPERGIHEFAKSGGDMAEHGRQRDADQAILPGSPELAVAALVLRDRDALRMAARFALCLAMSEHWEMGFMSHFPGGPWEDRAFRRSYTCQDIAEILDYAGEVFTETGRKYLLRRLAEEGVGPINYDTWRHEYLFHCNQLGYFNHGRMFAYLVLEREWPRVKPYTDLAYRDTLESLELAIQPDGGCLEGPGYLNPTVRENYLVLKHYARGRQLTLANLLPAAPRKTGDYAAAVASTTTNDVIPVCDSSADYHLEGLRLMAELMPQSYWVTLCNKRAQREAKPTLPQTGPALPALVQLPRTGYVASTRQTNGLLHKLLILGNAANAGHTHEDKGSFVLEYAGETFALDLGICDYDDPIHLVYKHCQRHNMLVPIGTTERPHPQNPLPVDVRPEAVGDAQSFTARIDATPGWDGFYRRWVRTWDSPAPDRLTIRDEYELAQGTGVEFYWQTRLPISIEGRTVRIQGQKGTLTLTTEPDLAARVEELPLFGGETYRRLALRKDGPQGRLEIEIRLSPANR